MTRWSAPEREDRDGSGALARQGSRGHEKAPRGFPPGLQSHQRSRRHADEFAGFARRVKRIRTSILEAPTLCETARNYPRPIKQSVHVCGIFHTIFYYFLHPASDNSRMGTHPSIQSGRI